MELVRIDVDERAAACVRAFRLTDRMHGVVIFGSVGPEALETSLEGVARQLLQTDADTCVAIVSGAPPERDERGFVSALSSLSAAAMMVGARVVFSIESATLRASVAEQLPDATVVDSFEAALALVEVSIERQRTSLDRIKGFFSGKK
jgi:hypothetical protein